MHEHVLYTVIRNVAAEGGDLYFMIAVLSCCIKLILQTAITVYNDNIVVIYVHVLPTCVNKIRPNRFLRLAEDIRRFTHVFILLDLVVLVLFCLC